MLISEWKPILYIVLAKAMSMHLILLWMCVSPSLYRYALGIVRSREVTEEIVSDVFMEVWKMRADLFLKFRRLRAGCERLLTVRP